MFDLSGRAALVTGGARGLGYAMAGALGRQGARLLLMDRDGEAVERATEALRAEGLTALGLAGDVTDPDQVAGVVERMVEQWGRVDICVNNAGVTVHAPAERMTLAEWQFVLDVNLTGVFVVAQACGRHMIAQRGGCIINIASMSGLIVNYPQPQCGYNVSKAGVIMLTKSLASEWAGHGIRVNAIAPGYMRTDMTAPYFRDPELVQHWVTPTPLGRPGEPSELEGAVVYLASDASSFMTGHVLVLDGGYSVR